MEIRTDLALEAKERYEENNVEIKGVILKKEYDKKCDMEITEVIIKDEFGAEAMKKPIGTYITLESEQLMYEDEDYHKDIAKRLSGYIKKLLPSKCESVLVIGLGNRNIISDALGTMSVSNLRINEKINALLPGVMAQTGMESLTIASAVSSRIKPDVVVAIDSLAARSTKRLGTTIQLTNTGITPGSGVGNHRKGFEKDTFNVPVIAIGVPTVVDAGTIIFDGISGVLSDLNVSERKKMINDLITPEMSDMYVTPKDIDETVKVLSFTVSESLNMAFDNIM